ncbi:4-hydroxy-tetrahydrodipicolinate synthase [Bradyrhizobium arachidis]|uniref:4-hydroxy-tetrahydrodipicolinate synthase family protein n=1 Tax=Bradyrhizobium TaxID=374 RepID=UPI0021619D43|nr:MULTISPECIES: 4-hydroxy-tetrahydrodipicolinate synthase [Bradyrhizobium]MDN4983661.1 4-hydroxy-tetrahydrodipicolinate synthase [Bradyrhizobium sp. WYCCWR 13022]UVO38041.1 4-hydroxy-tetrahydrodipicolinate synthase [Bradyrhizobium arachidis]
MTDLQTHMHGLWLPLVTPFRDGGLDETSLRRLTRHYAAQSIDGFILGATSGEGMTLRESELERLVAIVRDEMAAGRRNVPIGLGLSGADTSRLKDRLDETADWPIDFYLLASPYYVRPSQRGISAHFEALADHAAWPLALYNIPYRCAVGITNQTLLRLAEHPNIIGLKDCGASREQSIALLRDRPKSFRVLTGEDANYFEALGDGADGGILLSAHLETETFAAVYSELKRGNPGAAEARWQDVAELTRLLFTEPSPAPAKYWLWRTGLIDSPEVRLPMVEVSSELAATLDREIERRMQVAA